MLQLVSALAHRLVVDLPFLRPVSTPKTKSARERVRSEVTETLGVRGCSIDVGALEISDAQLLSLWNRVAPYMETPQFEDGASRLFVEASGAAQQFQIRPLSSPASNPQLEVELRAGLDLYQYLLPRVLLAAAVLRQSWSTNQSRPVDVSSDETAADKIFARLRRILRPSSNRSATAQMAVWEEHLQESAAYLGPIVSCESYQRASAGLSALSRELGANLCSLQVVTSSEAPTAALLQEVDKILRFLPELILKVSMLSALRSPSACVFGLLSTHVPPVTSRVVPQAKRRRIGALAAQPQLATA